MKFEADTLVQLTEVLRQHGMRLVADVAFIRAPYRHDHRWFCTVA
ncbi:hypothetical protein QIW53_17395 [Pseudomonas fluorescens]|jgi:hypothetical protein